MFLNSTYFLPYMFWNLLIFSIYEQLFVKHCTCYILIEKHHNTGFTLYQKKQQICNRPFLIRKLNGHKNTKKNKT